MKGFKQKRVVRNKWRRLKTPTTLGRDASTNTLYLFSFYFVFYFTFYALTGQHAFTSIRILGINKLSRSLRFSLHTRIYIQNLAIPSTLKYFSPLIVTWKKYSATISIFFFPLVKFAQRAKKSEVTENSLTRETLELFPLRYFYFYPFFLVNKTYSS